MARRSLIASCVRCVTSCYHQYPIITPTPSLEASRKSFSLEKFRINKKKEKRESFYIHTFSTLALTYSTRSIGRTGKLLWDIIFHRYDYVCRSLTSEKMCSGNLSDYLIKRASAFALTIELLVSYIKAMVSCCSERRIRESFRKNFNLISLPAQKSFLFQFCSEFI